MLKAAGEERSAMNLMLTNPDVLADYVNDFYGNSNDVLYSCLLLLLSLHHLLLSTLGHHHIEPAMKMFSTGKIYIIYSLCCIIVCIFILGPL